MSLKRLRSEANLYSLNVGVGSRDEPRALRRQCKDLAPAAEPSCSLPELFSDYARIRLQKGSQGNRSSTAGRSHQNHGALLLGAFWQSDYCNREALQRQGAGGQLRSRGRTGARRLIDNSYSCRNPTWNRDSELLIALVDQ